MEKFSIPRTKPLFQVNIATGSSGLVKVQCSIVPTHLMLDSSHVTAHLRLFNEMLQMLDGNKARRNSFDLFSDLCIGCQLVSKTKLNPLSLRLYSLIPQFLSDLLTHSLIAFTCASVTRLLRKPGFSVNQETSLHVLKKPGYRNSVYSCSRRVI